MTRPRRGISLVSVLIALSIALTIIASLHRLTLLTIREAKRASQSANTVYAAEAGLRSLLNQIASPLERGWLTTTDVAFANANVLRPSIANTAYDSLAITDGGFTTTTITPTATYNPYQGMRIWRRTLTLHARARNTQTGATTALERQLTLELVPFSQAAVTVLGRGEFYGGMNAATTIVGAPANGVPAIRSIGDLHLAPDTGSTSRLLIIGSVFAGAALYRNRYDLPAANTGAVRMQRSSLVSDTISVAPTWDVRTQGTTGLQAFLDAQFPTTNYKWQVTAGTLNLNGQPTTPEYPACQGSTPPGIFGLRCRANSTAAPDNANVFDVSSLTTASLGSKRILYLRQTNATIGYITLTNATTLPDTMTLVAEVPVILRGNFNTTSTKPAALIAPRIYADTQATPANTGTVVQYNGVIVTGFTPSVNSSAYYGGVLESAPILMGSHYWWQGQSLVINGAVIALPMGSAAWPGTVWRQPTRTITFDASLLNPAAWPPGLPGRYRLVTGTPYTLSR